MESLQILNEEEILLLDSESLQFEHQVNRIVCFFSKFAKFYIFLCFHMLLLQVYFCIISLEC